MKSAKRLLLLVPLLLAAAVAVGSLLAFSPRNQSQRPLIVSAVERDAAIPVLPWIPCSNASAHILTAHTVRVQQMRLASTFSQTYAATERTHLGMLGRLTGLVAARQYGADTTLCEPSGGIDRVSVLRLRQQGARASATIQFHVWNETIGTHNGVAFHYKPQGIVRLTDQLRKINGQWLVSRRGAPVFVSGQPG